MELDLDALNAELGNQPEKLVQWAIGLGNPPSAPPTSAPSKR